MSGHSGFVDAIISLLSKEGSAPAGKPDVRYGVRDVSSGHERDRTFHVSGHDPKRPDTFGESRLAGREPGY